MGYFYPFTGLSSVGRFCRRNLRGNSVKSAFAAATIRVLSAAVAIVSLTSCSSSSPADYSRSTIQQCEALGDHWPYTVTSEESRCIDTVFQRDSDQAEQHQLQFQNSQAAKLKAICKGNADSCHDLCAITPEDPTCASFRQQEAKKEIENDCTIFWNQPDLIKDKINDPDCQAARNRAAAKAKVAAAKAKAVAGAKEQRRQAAIKALDISDGQKQPLREKHVFMGASAEMVRLAWGAPDEINRTTTAFGIREQWVYGDQYLYLDNGVLTAIQTTR